MPKIVKNRISGLPALVTDYLGMSLALAGLIIFFGFKANNFFTLTTFRTIANQVPDITIVAVGMTFVLIIAGIDLSVGSVMALAGAVLGLCLIELNFPLPAAIVACLLVGVLCGALNGFPLSLRFLSSH
jgi:ribose transport system permease protein